MLEPRGQDNVDKQEIYWMTSVKDKEGETGAVGNAGESSAKEEEGGRRLGQSSLNHSA